VNGKAFVIVNRLRKKTNTMNNMKTQEEQPDAIMSSSTLEVDKFLKMAVAGIDR